MLSLIGSALGLFSSAIPKAMDMWQDKNDKLHELALLKAQAEITLDQTAIDASIWEVESLHQHEILKALLGLRIPERWSGRLWLTASWPCSLP